MLRPWDLKPLPYALYFSIKEAERLLPDGTQESCLKILPNTAPGFERSGSAAFLEQ